MTSKAAWEVTSAVRGDIGVGIRSELGRKWVWFGMV